MTTEREEEMAAAFRLPIIRVIEGSGGGGSVKTIETRGASNLPGGVGGNPLTPFGTAQQGHRQPARPHQPRQEQVSMRFLTFPVFVLAVVCTVFVARSIFLAATLTLRSVMIASRTTRRLRSMFRRFKGH